MANKEGHTEAQSPQRKAYLLDLKSEFKDFLCVLGGFARDAFFIVGFALLV
jgi:hypothetical protein